MKLSRDLLPARGMDTAAPASQQLAWRGIDRLQRFDARGRDPSPGAHGRSSPDL